MILNGTLPVDDNQKWVFVTIDDKQFTHVAPTEFTGQALQDYMEAREGNYRLDILKDMYPKALVPVIEGNTPVQNFEAWVANVHEENTTVLVTPGIYDPETGEELTLPVFETTVVSGPVNVITTVSVILEDGIPVVLTPATFNEETGEELTPVIYETVSETATTIIEKIPWTGIHPDEIYQISVLDFRKRFTPEEKVTIYSSTDPLIRIFLDDLSAAQHIDFRDEDLVNGINYLVLNELLTSERADEILIRF